MNDLGAVTKTDTTLMGVGPGMATSWKPGVAARIALAQKNAREQMKKISGGLFEVKTGFAPDKNGNVVPTGAYTGAVGSMGKAPGASKGYEITPVKK